MTIISKIFKSIIAWSRIMDSEKRSKCETCLHESSVVGDKFCLLCRQYNRSFTIGYICPDDMKYIQCDSRNCYIYKSTSRCYSCGLHLCHDFLNLKRMCCEVCNKVKISFGKNVSEGVKDMILGK